MLRKYLLGILVLGGLLSGHGLGAADVKRRLLLLAPENMGTGNAFKRIPENVTSKLRAEFEQSGRYEIMDANLLLKVDPDAQIAKLSAAEAVVLAQMSNCEAVIYGRYLVSKKAGRDSVLLQIEAADVVAKKYVHISSQQIDVDAKLDQALADTAKGIFDDTNRKLPDLRVKDLSRDAKKEKIILRTLHPPKGFLDALAFGDRLIEPEFDIDVFDYNVEVPRSDINEKTALPIKYSPWGNKVKLAFDGSGVSCNAGQCSVERDGATLVLSDAARKDAPKYRFIFKKDVASPKITRTHVWLTGGFPYFKSLPLPGNSNPAVLATDGGMPLDAFKGMANAELGISPGWARLPWGFRVALALQAFYGTGDVAQNGAANADFKFLSAGGGLRFERRIVFGAYTLAPLLAFYTHYQKFFRGWDRSLNTVGFIPEIGLNHYLRLGNKWQLMLTTVVGSMLYSGQNLSYVRANLGVEYGF